MKIDHTPHLPKILADPAAVSTVKDGASVLATRGPATSAASAAPSATLELPLIQGDFDAQRVNRIRDDIRAGRYTIDTSKIADGLLATVRDLVGARRP